MAWAANRNSSTTSYEQIRSKSRVCFQMHWASHEAGDLRLSMKNGEVQNPRRDLPIQNCRQHRHWSRHHSSQGLLQNFPFQAPSSRWTNTAQQGGTKRRQVKIPPYFKIVRVHCVRKENLSQKVKEGANFTLEWVFETKSCLILKKTSNFFQTQRATYHPSDLVPYSQETKAQKQIFPKEKGLLSWEREACA